MDSPLLPGTKLSHYEIRSKIGAGGMGEVYLAQDTKLDRKVALKILPADVANDPQRLRRFVQEAKAVSALNHPNIITIHQIDRIESIDFIATEFIEGVTLRQHLEKTRIKIGETLDIALQITAALAAAHAAGIVHRDIKPENIMLRADGYVKVLDFGLAKLVEQPTTLVDAEAQTRALFKTEPGLVVGTLHYMSPEQARGLEVDARTDIFSFGAVLYEMLAGRIPFKGDSKADIFVSLLERDPPPLAQYSSDIPPELEHIVRMCLAKDREQRYQSMAELVSDLKNVTTRLSQGLYVSGAEATQQFPAATATAIAPGPSIAVLPFDNLSADAENEYFCDGLAEDLINALSKVDQLRVMARTSAFALKGKNLSVSEIGGILKVGTVVEGSVRKAGNRLRINVQLINVADGYPLWSERYDQEMADIFEVQDEISLAIVKALKVKLLGGEEAEVRKRHTENAKAYELYLKGRYQFNKWSEEGYLRAIGFFEQAITEAPDYALAYCGLSDSYSNLRYFGFMPSSEVLPKQRAAAMKALEIDPTLAEAHISLAYLKLFYEWDWPGAEQQFNQGLSLNPHFAIERSMYGLLLGITNRPAEALAQGERALELDPLSLVSSMDVGWIFWAARDYQRMKEQGRRLIELEPLFYGGYLLMGMAAWSNLEYEEAIEAMEKTVALGGGLMMMGHLGHLYGEAGQTEKAQQVLDQLFALREQRYVPSFHIGLAYAGLGELDRAFEWLEKACEEHDGPLIFLGLYGSSRNCLRADPRLAAILQKMNLPLIAT